MKKLMLTFMIVPIVLSMVFADLSPEFNKLKKAIHSSIPEGYEVNNGQIWDHRHTMKKIAYDWDESQMNTLIYSWKLKNKSFTEMDFLYDHKKIKYLGREALFIDGSKTGMSSIKVILKNGAGIFELTHRSLEGNARNQTALETLMAKVQLDILEKQSLCHVHYPFTGDGFDFLKIISEVCCRISFFNKRGIKTQYVVKGGKKLFRKLNSFRKY